MSPQLHVQWCHIGSLKSIMWEHLHHRKPGVTHSPARALDGTYREQRPLEMNVPASNPYSQRRSSFVFEEFIRAFPTWGISAGSHQRCMPDKLNNQGRRCELLGSQSVGHILLRHWMRPEEMTQR